MAIEDGLCLAELHRTRPTATSRPPSGATRRPGACAPRACSSNPRDLWDVLSRRRHRAGRATGRRWRARDEADTFQCLAWLYDGFALPPGAARGADDRALETCSTRRHQISTSIGRRRESARVRRSGRRMSKHVAVLMGGWSAEREVSLRSGKACADALERQRLSGHPRRRRPRHRHRARRRQARRGAQRAARLPGRGRHAAGPAGDRRRSPTPIPACWPRRVAMQKDIAKVLLPRRRRPGAGGDGRRRASRRPSATSCRRPM